MIRYICADCGAELESSYFDLDTEEIEPCKTCLEKMTQAGVEIGKALVRFDDYILSSENAGEVQGD